MKPTLMMKWMLSTTAFGLILTGIFSPALASAPQDAASHEEEAVEAGHVGGHSIGVQQPLPNREKVAVPGRVTLLEPKPFAKTSSSVKFSWKPVEGAEVYQIQVATDPRYKWLVANEQNLTGTSFELQNLEKGRQYFWRVAARRPDNNPSYTKGFFTAWSFEVQ